jgi:hypothetical protein
LILAADSVEAELTLDQALVPIEFEALTQKKYLVPGLRPVIVLGEDPETIVDGVTELVPYPTSYPVIGDPPFAGMFHNSTTEV